MPQTGERQPYTAPTVTYKGTVADITQSHHLALGAKAVTFAVAFAASTGTQVVAPGGSETITVPGSSQPGATPGTVTPGTTVTSPGQVTDIVQNPGGGTGGVTGSAGGSPSAATGAGGSGKELPFTGFAVVGVAGVGAALASAGTVLRRIARRGDVA
jgi:hypothetical protein